MSAASPLAPLDVWASTDGLSAIEAVVFARHVEALGYSTLWMPEAIGRDPFAHIGFLAAQTSTLRFATGIANIFHRHPGAMMQAARTLAEQSAGRFVLGLGVSHAPLVAGLRKLDYSNPLRQMREYLAAMDASPYGAVEPAAPPLRLLAALGPKMLELAAEQTDGAHPYFTTPEHTAQARAILGPDKLLCVEQKVVLTTDAATARATADGAIKVYAGLPNYRNNWKRLGYTDEEIDGQVPRFVDAVVAWGDAAAIRLRLQAHLDAGATHVCIQPLSTSGSRTPDVAVLEALAPGS